MLSWPAFAPGRRSRASWVAAALFLSAAAAAAQPPAAPAGTSVEPDPEIAHVTAPVVVDGATLFRVRGSSGYPAEERARRIAERIVEVARVPSIAPEAVRAEPSEGLFNVTAGDRVLLVVTAADARVEAIEQAVVARIYVDRIQRAVRAYREARRPAVLVDGARRAAAATAVLAVALLAMVLAYRRLRARVARRYQERVHSVQFQSFEIVRAQRIWDAFETVMRLVRLATVAVLAYFWLHFVLSSFPVTRPLAARLLSLVLEPLSLLGGGLLAQLPNLAFLLVLYFVTRWLLGLVRLFFDAVGKGRVELAGFEPEWALPTYRILRVVVVGLAVVVAYPYIPGSQSAAFQGISIFLGLMFSLGSSSFIANSIAGYSMTYRRAFRIGDRIRVGDTFGDVTEIRLQVTHLRSPKNEEIVVPNSTLLTSSVVNYSALARTHGLILHTTVGIGYETPWRQVEAMLLMAAERTEGLSRDREPFVLQKSLGDFCVVYELNVYCDAPAEMMGLYARLHRNILDVFNEYGVQIMTPAYEGDPDRPKVVPKEEWWTAPALRPSGSPEENGAADNG